MSLISKYDEYIPITFNLEALYSLFWKKSILFIGSHLWHGYSVSTGSVIAKHSGICQSSQGCPSQSKYDDKGKHYASLNYITDAGVLQSIIENNFKITQKWPPVNFLTSSNSDWVFKTFNDFIIEIIQSARKAAFLHS